MQTKNGLIYLEYCRIQNQVRQATQKATREHEKLIAAEAKTNPKKFWRYVHSKLKTSSGIGDLIIPNETAPNGDPVLATTDAEKAEVLNEYFASVFTHEDDNIPDFSIKTPCPGINELVITPEMVHKKLQKLDISKSLGPDQFHPRVLKKLCEVLAEPLSIIFTESLRSKQLPSDWKQGNITAIFKKGDKRQAGNYRPVSLTSIICKVMESIVRDHVISHMLSNQLFSDKQFGFISGWSTTLQLLWVLDEWTSILDSGGGIDAIYCDFQKAFDKVPHRRLLHKLRGYGVNGDVHDWINSFLSGRTQQVVVNGVTSSNASVTSGIPQGSVLGPLLFVVYINDMPDVVDNLSRVWLFADDTKVYRQINTIEDCEKLQKDLSALQYWSQDWLLMFHPEKCKALRSFCSFSQSSIVLIWR